VVLSRLTERKEWRFFAVLPKADPRLAAAWWTALLLRGRQLTADYLVVRSA
jgi:ATP-binding cassette, subfamily B, bacterial